MIHVEDANVIQSHILGASKYPVISATVYDEKHFMVRIFQETGGRLDSWAGRLTPIVSDLSCLQVQLLLRAHIPFLSQLVRVPCIIRLDQPQIIEEHSISILTTEDVETFLHAS